MNDAALKTLLDALEKCRGSLDSWLTFWTWVVVIGVALELVFAVHEHREALALWRPGIVRSPEKPLFAWFVFELFAIALVTIGIVGELKIEASLGTLETRIQDVNGRRLLLLQQEAGSAEASAEGAAKAADKANAASGTAIEKANTANTTAKSALETANTATSQVNSLQNAIASARSEVIRLQAEVARVDEKYSGRTLSKNNRDILVTSLRNATYKPNEVVSVSTADSVPDGKAYAKEISEAISDPSTGWKATYGDMEFTPVSAQTGVLIVVRSEDTEPNWAIALQQALTSAGIETRPSLDSRVPEWTAHILILRKN